MVIWARRASLPSQAQQRVTLFPPDCFIYVFFFKKNLITFILIPLLSFILFRGPLLNNIDILIMRLIFEEFFMIHL